MSKTANTDYTWFASIILNYLILNNDFLKIHLVEGLFKISHANGGITVPIFAVYILKKDLQFSFVFIRDKKGILQP
ncbi:MAG: hypothetical protein PWR01_1187 [Clostridiales bacterium]|nr:hypothetical protein [Clostridiales bacterium]